MSVALWFTIIFVLFTLKDKPTAACALAVQFPGRFMNFSFEFGSALGSAEMLFFSATTSRMARTATYPSIHYLYPGLSSRGESGRSMKLNGHLTVQRIRILEAAGFLSHSIHCLVLNPLYHCVVTIFTTWINIKQLYIVPRQCVFCIILTTDYMYVPTYHGRVDICNRDAVCLFEVVVIYNLHRCLFPRPQTLWLVHSIELSVHRGLTPTTLTSEALHLSRTSMYVPKTNLKDSLRMGRYNMLPVFSCVYFSFAILLPSPYNSHTFMSFSVPWISEVQGYS